MQPVTKNLSPVTCHLSQRSGFTLIELVLVTVVIAILVAAAVPRFATTAARLRLEQQAFSVTQWLRYAHELAVSEARESVWAWDPGARHTYVLEHLPADSQTGAEQWLDRSPSARSPLARETPLTLTQEEPVGCPDTLSPNAGCIHFFPDGTSESALVTLGSAEPFYTISVDGTTSHIVLTPGTPAR